MTVRFLLRGGCVLTLGAKSPNFLLADVLIDEGKVVEVGRGLRARDAEPVDATDTVVMPGFVDTHRHASLSLLRNLGEGGTAVAGARTRPEDRYAATLIGLLGAIEAGITTVVDWSDAELEDGSAEAELQAHADAGLRTVFVHAARHRTRGDADAEPSSRGSLERLVDAAGPSTTVAVGVELEPADLDRAARECARARELGLRIHAHAASGTTPGAVSAAAGIGLLAADVTLVHCSELDGDDVEAIAASGASVSLTPSSDMAGGLGAPPIQQLIGRDIRPGLGVGDERMAPGDLFAQMRATISLQHATVFDRKLAGKAGLPRLMSTRDVIRAATVEGARVAGLGGVTGSLEPGLQADIVVLRTDRPNVFPVNDPIGAVVWGMDTSNLGWVFAGGRVLMRDGVLQADVQRARALAMTAREWVAPASGLVVGAASGGEA
ncbi:MAG: amidohydrolase family protein [Actinomycetota bacterium]